MGGLLGGKAENVNNPVSPEMLAQAHANAQTGLSQQQSFMNALAAQNGIQNQSDMYNQFGQVAAGQGPNPAAAQLANSTHANIANQAALAAGQRGAAQNVGMIARQAGMQGGSLQQDAAGQAAAMQAQQSLSAMGQQAGIAGQQVGNQAQATQGYLNGALNQQGTMITGMNAGNENTIKNQAMENASRQKMAGMAMQGGAMAATGGASAAMPQPQAHGGMIESKQKLSAGGSVVAGVKAMGDYLMDEKPSAPAAKATPKKGEKLVGTTDTTDTTTPKQQTQTAASGGEIKKKSIVEHLMMAMGGQVPVMVSPGEAYIPPGAVNAVARGADPRAVGNVIPGTAKVKGDSLKNDTVPTKLQEGGVVIPRTVMNAKDHEAAASKFVQAVLSKKGSLRGKK